MKNKSAKFLVRLAMGLGVFALAVQHCSAIHLDFAALTDANVSFSGGNFVFNNNGGGYSFQITDSSGTGDSIGDNGNIAGTFAIGTITTLGGLQTAPVTGSGTVTINDGSLDLTGTVVWDEISTFGTGGTINVNGILNLTSITYSGLQSDLIALAASGVATDTITFQFVPGKTLTQLKGATTPIVTSFSGSIDTPVPDGGLTIALLGFALVGVEGLRRKLAK
jgi:hypothetical protein